MSARIGSLFSGYGGLDLAVSSVLDAETRWVCEFEEAPSRILAHHWPDAPNLGDITAVDWSQVEPVDVLAGGFPCQDVSHAGRRAGLIRDGEGRTRSGLWGEMLRAITELKPRLVVAENVRGLLSAGADSDMEPCPWCLGDGPSDRPMRALGAVLADLADAGYDAAWTSLRAADVGAPHGRFRVFILAWPADTESNEGWPRNGDGGATAYAHHRPRDGQWPRSVPRGRSAADEPPTLLRTPTAQLAVNGGSQHPDKRRDGGHGPTLADEIEHLLPTPAVNDMGRAYTPDDWDAWTDRMKAAHGNGNGHGASLSIEALRMLPTPRADEGGGNGTAEVERRSPGLQNIRTHFPDHRFGDYAPAISRWGNILGRPAPAPTEATGRNGAHRLSPSFVEWMQGLPTGWVTDTPGVTRNQQLKALGNGVVPQQGTEALRRLLAIREMALRQERAA